MSNYGYNSGYGLGAAQGFNSLAQQLAQRASSGQSSVLGRAFGGNEMEGGVQLNPDGTVASVSEVKLKHPTVDALLNWGAGGRRANEQNDYIKQHALQLQQLQMLAKQQAEQARLAREQEQKFLEKQALDKSIDDYGRANNVMVRKQDGTLTDAGHAAMSTLDPMKVQNTVEQMRRANEIASNPDVKAANLRGAVAQGVSPEVDNAAKLMGASKTVQGGTTLTFNPSKDLNPTGTITGGTATEDRVTQPVISNIGGIPQHIGDKTTSSSSIAPGGYTPAAVPIPANILDKLFTTNSAGVTSEPKTQAATTQPQQGNFVQGLGGLLQQIGSGMGQGQAVLPVDMSAANALLGQGMSLANLVKPKANLGEINLNPEEQTDESQMSPEEKKSMFMKLIRGF